MPHEDFRELNGLRHHIVEWDAPPGVPTLVLLHGYLDLAWSFAPFAAALQARMPVRLIAPDLRGHGETEWVGRGGYYHFADYVADVHALLTALPKPLWLLGHSMGGSLSAILAGTFPDLISRLVLVEGLGPASRDDDPADRMAQWIQEVGERREKPSRPMTLAEAARRLQDKHVRLPDELAKFLAEKGTRAVDGGYVWSFDPLHRTRSPAPFPLDQFRRFLKRIACPTLLVEGSESWFRAFVDVDGRDRDIAGREVKVIDQASHMIHQEQPEALASVVAEFLRR